MKIAAHAGFQFFSDEFGGAIGDGHDGEDRIEAAVGDVDAAIDTKRLSMPCTWQCGIDHGSFGIVAHAAGAGLVLAAAQAFAGQFGPGSAGAGFLSQAARLPAT